MASAPGRDCPDNSSVIFLYCNRIGPVTHLDNLSGDCGISLGLSRSRGGRPRSFKSSHHLIDIDSPSHMKGRGKSATLRVL